MSNVFGDFRKNVRTARSLMGQQRDAMSRAAEDEAQLLSGSRAAIDSSRELIKKTDAVIDGVCIGKKSRR